MPAVYPRLTVLLAAVLTPLAAFSQPPGMPGGQQRQLLAQFDADHNGWLNSEERQAARKFLQTDTAQRRGPGGGPGGPGGGPGRFDGRGFGPPPGFGGPPPGFEGPPPGFGGPPPGFEGPPPGFGGWAGGGRPGGGRPPGGLGMMRPEATPGATVDKASVQPLNNDLYDTGVLRTLFIDFENPDWETELETFHGTDVDVPATVTVDGKALANCGVHFRGMSSYGMVPAGYKRSLNISVDMADSQQRLLGYKTLNLLNGSGDESMMSTVLFSQIARH